MFDCVTKNTAISDNASSGTCKVIDTTITIAQPSTQRMVTLARPGNAPSSERRKRGQLPRAAAARRDGARRRRARS